MNAEKIEPTFQLFNRFELLDNISLSENKSHHHYNYPVMSLRTKRNIGDDHTAAISDDHIIYSARHTKDRFANGFILNTEFKPTRDNHIANDFANLTKNALPSTMASHLHSFVRLNISHSHTFDLLHASRSQSISQSITQIISRSHRQSRSQSHSQSRSQSHSQSRSQSHNQMHTQNHELNLTNKTITDYSTKISHWDLNESSRSLFIALSGTTPAIIRRNPEKSEADFPLVVKQNREYYYTFVIKRY